MVRMKAPYHVGKLVRKAPYYVRKLWLWEQEQRHVEEERLK